MRSVLLTWITLFYILLFVAKAEKRITLTFHNELPEDIEVFWEGEENNRVSLFTVKANGGEETDRTFPDHLFSYTYQGTMYYIRAPHGQPAAFSVLIDREIVQVRCTMKHDETLFFDMDIHPEWSPRGAAHFLTLVRNQYYDGVALNRVVPNFLAQFGMSADPDKRTQWRWKEIPDDPPAGVPFEPGSMSYAGSGFDSRSTEVFIVMPGTPQHQLEAFGTNYWETPFGIVKNVEETPVADFYKGYGDMPPWGRGPDPKKIYLKNGYDYLAKEFPKLSYLGKCVIVEGDDEDEEL